MIAALAYNSCGQTSRSCKNYYCSCRKKYNSIVDTIDIHIQTDSLNDPDEI
jgi:hypothetical protein